MCVCVVSMFHMFVCSRLPVRLIRLFCSVVLCCVVFCSVLFCFCSVLFCSAVFVLFECF